MANNFNLEDKIKWSELSPSLQNKFKELDEGVRDQLLNYDRRMNSVRMTFSDTAPFNPKNNAEIWIDKKYRVIRAFAKNNWEFTRAAWYAGPSTGIVHPPTTDGDVGTPDVPPYVPTVHTTGYLTHTESALSNSHQWNPDICVVESDGSISVRYVFSGTEPKVNISVNVNSLTNTSTEVVGYLLGVTGNHSDGGMEFGQSHLWEISKGRGSFTETISLNTGDYCIFDVDSKSNKVIKIVPGDKPNDTVYGSTYFPSEFPYRYPISTWSNPTSTPPDPVRNYPAVKGSFSITITLSEKY